MQTPASRRLVGAKAGAPVQDAPPALFGHILYVHSPSFFLEGRGSRVLPPRPFLETLLLSLQATRALSWDPLVVWSELLPQGTFLEWPHAFCFSREHETFPSQTLPDPPLPPGPAASPSHLS